MSHNIKTSEPVALVITNADTWIVASVIHCNGKYQYMEVLIQSEFMSKITRMPALLNFLTTFTEIIMLLRTRGRDEKMHTTF
jgi:hypothetical protein